jgi:virginiamycin B lyase
MRVVFRPLAGLLVIVGTAAAVATAQQATRDAYQRSAAIYAMKSTAPGGWQRGEEIYYFKCWFCHNQYAKNGGPPFNDLYKRGTFLMTGAPVTDQAVADKIRSGGPLMPAYRHSLTDADLTDLVTYIKSGKCCFDAEEPPRNPRYTLSGDVRAQTPTGIRPALLGGARGSVRSSTGMALEGIGVQLIDPRTAIRTTVYSNANGRYEFPIMEPGDYTLRIARPLEFKPYLKERVRIEGAVALPEIVLERVSDTEFLPPTPEILGQLSSVEWLMNLPGTAQEKKVFSNQCTHCHSYQQIFRNRFDEASWLHLTRRMGFAGGSPLINYTPTPQPNANQLLLARWLARIRGPESAEPAGIQPLPWPRGAETRVIVTEYELPRELLSPHDVHGDLRGNIWYTTHRSPYAGVLDPRTGKVTEYRIPAGREEDTKGALPGTHRLWVDKNDVVWFSEQWDHFLTGLDAKTGRQLKRYSFVNEYTRNSSGMSNFAMDDLGYAYETSDKGELLKIDTRTGNVERIPFPKDKHVDGVYDNTVTPDGRYWVGGDGNYLGLWDLKTREFWDFPARTPFVSYSRGAMDTFGNAWFTGRGSGLLVKLDIAAKKLTEYAPPLPHTTLYEALADKNGEVWVAPIQAGRYFRFNPRTEKWIAYPMPEPYSHNRRAWIDNSTNPVTLWYVDQNNYLVRLQPLD